MKNNFLIPGNLYVINWEKVVGGCGPWKYKQHEPKYWRFPFDYLRDTIFESDKLIDLLAPVMFIKSLGYGFNPHTNEYTIHQGQINPINWIGWNIFLQKDKKIIILSTCVLLTAEGNEIVSDFY